MTSTTKTIKDLSPLLALADGRYTVYLYKPEGTAPENGVGYTACVKVGDYEGGDGVHCLVINTTNETVFLRIQHLCRNLWGDGDEDDSRGDGVLDRFIWQG
jgi:hypothetical protein